MDKIKELQVEFEACQNLLVAFGDGVRQKLLLLMLAGDRNGVRVSDIADKTNLTRSAVSHHMQILKNTGLIGSRKEGKCIYYFLDSSGKDVEALARLFLKVRNVIKNDGMDILEG